MLASQSSSRIGRRPLRNTRGGTHATPFLPGLGPGPHSQIEMEINMSTTPALRVF